MADRGTLDDSRRQAALDLLADCLCDEDPWDEERLVARMEAVYVALGGDLADV